MGEGKNDVTSNRAKIAANYSRFGWILDYSLPSRTGWMVEFFAGTLQFWYANGCVGPLNSRMAPEFCVRLHTGPVQTAKPYAFFAGCASCEYLPSSRSNEAGLRYP